MCKKLLFAFLFLILASSVFAQTVSRGPSGPAVQPGREFEFRINESLTTKLVKSPLFWALIVASFFWIRSYPKKKTSRSFILMGIGIGAGLIFTVSALSAGPAVSHEVPVGEWQELYADGLPEELESYTGATDYYDYNSRTMQSVISMILLNSESEMDAVQNALDYVYANVPYNRYESDNVCFDATSTSVLESKTGQCDTQSISVIGLLRGMGIAARPVGGCLSISPSCDFKMSLMSAAGVDVRRPQFEELGEVNTSSPYIGRGAITSRKGGLHAWAEYYSVDEGAWIILEPTAGEIVTSNCWDYNVELYPEDDDKFHLCVSDNLDYAVWCGQQ